MKGGVRAQVELTEAPKSCDDEDKSDQNRNTFPIPRQYTYREVSQQLFSRPFARRQGLAREWPSGAVWTNRLFDLVNDNDVDVEEKGGEDECRISSADAIAEGVVVVGGRKVIREGTMTDAKSRPPDCRLGKTLSTGHSHGIPFPLTSTTGPFHFTITVLLSFPSLSSQIYPCEQYHVFCLVHQIRV